MTGADKELIQHVLAAIGGHMDSDKFGNPKLEYRTTFSGNQSLRGQVLSSFY